MFQTETIVYYDESYPTSWIERGHSFAIASFFTKNGMKYEDANGLRKFITTNLDRGTAYKKIIVFSQDIIPDTICENYSSDTLFREFLDQGGNVIWIGDIPLYYIGIRGAKTGGDSMQSWQGVAPTNMLGIVTTSVSTLRAVRLKQSGKTLGLQHHWTSARPVIKDNTMTVLAVSDNIGTDYHINVPKSPGLISRIKRKIKVESVEFQGIRLASGTDDAVEPLTRMTRLKAGEHEFTLKSTLYETHPAAWIKNYNVDFRANGFARLWDYHIRFLPQSMVEELFRFHKNFSEKIKWQKLGTKK